jgi:uncharacterized radical SAM superfamily Fe-S cluster-containing enzyme
MKIDVGDEVQTFNLEDIVARDRTDETSFTYTGTAIPPIPKGLPKTIESLCPECLKVIEARLFAEDGKVMIEKTCAEHGLFNDIYWSDVDMYLRAEDFTYGEGKGLSNPTVTGASHCPTDCGLCNQHVSHTSLGNVDLTNRCDMRCPVCFADAANAGYVYEPDMETIKGMLLAYREMKPVAGRVIQFSGGEPTVHPQFFEIVSMARDLGFTHLQMASNGLNLADPEFCRKTAEAGMHTVYLQFDGCNDEVHRKTRGQSGYYAEKLKALENMKRYGIHVVFTPTIVRGFNDDQVGPILQFAIENAEICSGIAYQPVAITGRIAEKRRHQMRYTIPDLAIDIERQTGIIRREHWYPISCTSPFSKLFMAMRGRETINITCHPHCSLATYLIVNIDDPINSATPLPEFVDVPGMLRDMNELAFKASRARVKFFTKVGIFNSLRKHFNGKKAPKGLSFPKFLEALNGLVDKDIGRAGRGTQWKFMLIGAMHFMDAYNYDVSRVKRCCIHYSTPDGMFPFCTYNSGPFNREQVERNNSVPLEEYSARRGQA